MRVFLLSLVALLLLSTPAFAHGMRSAYVELHELEGNHARVVVRSGATYGGIHVVMPEGCTVEEHDIYACDAPLAGRSIRIDGLGGVVADAVVTAHLLDGSRPSELVRAGAATWTIPHESRGFESIGKLARAGFFHVLGGFDHLAFLAALVVLLRRFRAVLVAETAFTISHALSMSAAALGWIHVPAVAAESLIALSLVLVALDVGRANASVRHGARSAFVFGAVHGLGFAGGLEELGVARDAIVPALGGFALGVEVAQVVFLVSFFALRRLLRGHPRFDLATAYAVGITGCFWLLERASALL